MRIMFLIFNQSTESTEDVIIDNLISGYITAALFIFLYQIKSRHINVVCLIFNT